MENNDPRQIRIRKYRSILRSIGAGIVVFSAWSVIKSAGLTLVDPDNSFEAVTVLLLALDMLMRIYVGRSAIAVGNGQKRGKAYIIFAVFMLAGSAFVLAFLGLILAHPEITGRVNGLYTSMFIEITSDVLIAEMIIVSGKLKKAERCGGKQ